MANSENLPKNSQQVSDKKRYFEPAPQDIDVENFRKVIESRRSVRKFTDKAIPTEVLDACLDLALIAPNSSNLQPWTFYVVQHLSLIHIPSPRDQR